MIYMYKISGFSCKILEKDVHETAYMEVVWSITGKRIYYSTTVGSEVLTILGKQHIT